MKGTDISIVLLHHLLLVSHVEVHLVRTITHKVIAIFSIGLLHITGPLILQKGDALALAAVARLPLVWVLYGCLVRQEDTGCSLLLVAHGVLGLISRTLLAPLRLIDAGRVVNRILEVALTISVLPIAILLFLGSIATMI